MKIKHVSSGQQWWIPHELMKLHCSPLWCWNASERSLKHDQSPAAFELFIQWIYTRTYVEKAGLVVAFGSTNSDDISLTGATASKGNGRMAWSIKAAILAWDIGRYVGCLELQNYAMGRLFAAFSRSTPPPSLVTADVFAYIQAGRNEISFIGRTAAELCDFFEDIVVRNWGDEAVLHHGDQKQWSEMLSQSATFRNKFLAGTMQPLEKRRGTAMKLESYLAATYSEGIEEEV